MMEPPGRSAHLDAPPTLHAGITEPIGTHRQDLTTFVVENPELERLEQLLAQFNIFDAIGVARQELRHSDFWRSC